MARIRTIKPEFWTDGTIIGLPFEARLFYIGMWNHACDRGHLSDDPFGLKLKVLPADPVDGDELLKALVDAGRVERIILPGGRRYLSIPRFTDHQRVDTRWNSRCPVCAHLDSLDPAETHASSHKLVPGGEGKGKESKGGEAADAPLSPYCSKHPNGTEDPCRPCGTARTRFERETSSKKAKPSPVPFTVAPGSTCPDGKHKLVADGTCIRCEYRQEFA